MYCTFVVLYCHLALSSSTIFLHILVPTARFSESLLNMKCAFWFFLKFLILKGTEGDVIKDMYRSSCKAPFFLVKFELILNFLDRFSRNPQISNFIKIHPVEAKLFHSDGRTDMTKLMVAFRDFASAPNKLKLFLIDRL
jgi:hypothetical protein